MSILAFSRYALALLFVGAGILHFVRPGIYLRIMPPQLPAPLLVAVFPANVYMALIHERLHIPGWVAWERLPLQLPLLWWVWRVM